MWAWAVTIAFAGTGELPFRGESLTATAYAIMHSEPTVGPLPEPLGSIIHRCLSKNPAFRPSAHGALSQLMAAGAQLEGPLPPEAPAVPVDDGAPSAQPAYAVVPEPRHGDSGPNDARPASAEPQVAQRGSGRRRWRWAAAVVVPVLLAAGIIVAVNLAGHGAPPPRPTGQRAGGSPALSGEAAIRARAVSWIVHQVSRSALVACDAQVCAELASNGFPQGNLITIGPTSNDPLVANLVVSTALVRAQLRDRLATVWAPAIIAAFGSGNARIEIRLEWPGGAKSYRAVQGVYARDREAEDALLLTNTSVELSATASAQLRSGNIDPLLPELIVTMVHYHPLQIVDFGSASPGGGPASLLRSMDLATADPSAHLSSSKYSNWMRSFIRAQRTKYHPALKTVKLATGQTVLRVGYGAPSPLNPRSG
jgi:hypothetical protein